MEESNISTVVSLKPVGNEPGCTTCNSFQPISDWLAPKSIQKVGLQLLSIGW